MLILNLLKLVDYFNLKNDDDDDDEYNEDNFTMLNVEDITKKKKIWLIPLE
jgi:hypothetical protein